jgi:hypothetical protein
MMSARKAEFGDPLVTGAGYLDILGALRSTWVAADTPSPRAFPDVEAGRIAFENTAVLWGNEAFSLRALWQGSVAWTDPTEFQAPLLLTDGEMWPINENQGEVWPDSEVWPESETWPDSPAWTRAVTNPEETGPVVTEALSTGFRDP